MQVRRVLVSFIAVGLLVVGLIPPSSAQQGVVFEGIGSSKALDLSIPALQGLDQPLIGGFSAAVSTVEFDSSGIVAGKAAGLCDFFTGDLDTSNCEAGTFQETNVSDPGDAAPACALLVELPASPPVLTVGSACGNSQSAFVSGFPKGTNEAEILTTSLALDLTGIDPVVEDLKDTIVTDVALLLKDVFDITPSQPQLDKLEDTLLEILGQIADDPDFRALGVELGAGSSIVTSSDGVVKVTSEAGGLAIYLLGLEPLSENALITISISEGTSIAAFDSKTGKATSSATGATVKVEIKDILGLPDVGPLTAAVPLNTVLGLLKNTPLETEIEVGGAENSASGGTASASTSGVMIHALKGIGDPTPDNEEMDGGILLRIAASDVSIAGALPNQDPPVLPNTGRQSVIFGLLAVLGVSLALLLRHYAKRIRTQA